MKIAVDAMGGDHAPAVVVKGVEQARDQWPDLEFVLFGDVAQVKPLIKDEQRLTLVQSNSVITNEDEPVKAVRSKKDSSMVMAAQAVKNGAADAIFSMGNTGALLATGIFVIGRIKGIDRPALMPTLPSVDPDKVVNLLDAGANAESKPNYLEQWALMGSIYARDIRGIKEPRIALLNNGTEYDKGDSLHQEVYQRLQANPNLNFVGNVEAGNLLNDQADVIVSDGFTGNAVLKATEGMASLLMKQIKHALLNNGTKVKLGAALIKPAFGDIKNRFSTSANGGAVLLGVNAPVVKTHGGSDEGAVVSTIGQIREMLRKQTIHQVIEYLQTNPIK
ncbi:phosphate acyltransferase PlsX [Lapidilactobacillus luobeiensis]|uniref:phosphate acyltransferase PlsX n=1 Tax=Lapidilactobacillus luobeiensis TaxID=2950371 RepID=UPI0021C46082|nr:phosphate acyltransferase PlsX [Lapidilactobacillus luobeiensis]